jgi:hypothetical protein
MEEKKEQRAASAARPAAQSVKLRKFAAPEVLDGSFGVQGQTEDHIYGVIESKNVRALLDGFGLQDRRDVVFPFQHLKKQHGEIWSMRIEPADVHTVEGEPVFGHQWTFMQQLPERVGAAQ